MSEVVVSSDQIGIYMYYRNEMKETECIHKMGFLLGGHFTHNTVTYSTIGIYLTQV